MQAELILFDIGNTSIKVVLADRERTLFHYALPTGASCTADSLGITLTNLLAHARMNTAGIAACVASSVVPDFDPLLAEAVERYTGKPLFFVPNDIAIPMENRYERPEEVGADRLVGAYSARRLFMETPSLIVVDFGTAVTLDCVEGQAYLGGLIFPGPATALSALTRDAAKLPRINLDISEREPIIGRGTSTSMRHGIVFGFASLVEGLVQKLKQQLRGPTKVLGAGGFAQSIARISPIFDMVVPPLIPEGLRRLYYESDMDTSKTDK